MNIMNNQAKKVLKSSSNCLAEQDEFSRPIWIRGPQGGSTEFFTGLSRGKMHALEAAGLVKTASLRPKGAAPVRLFSLQRLLSYVESCARTDAKGKETNANT
jgi:hypothetical protein